MGSSSSVLFLGQFSLRRQGLIVVQIKDVLSHYVPAIIKHFHGDGGDIMHDDDASILEAQGVTEWGDEFKDDVNHMRQSGHLRPAGGSTSRH